MPLVTPQGFRPTPVDETATFADVKEALASNVLDLAPDAEIEKLGTALAGAELIRIRFDAFSDGRGFSLARRLRNLGYRGRLRATGHVISDQFRYALACGFDDVEISDELAQRQPETDWLASHAPVANYRDRLGGRASAQPTPPDPERSQQTGDAGATPYQSQPGTFEQRVTHVEHYTDGLFSFRITRPASFRFRSGEFAMIGLPHAARPVFRAYSVASPAWDDHLEFYSIKVPGGPLTQHLQHIEAGDTVLLKKKATGTLVVDALLPGRRLFLFSTGTGIAPFASIVRDPETYEKFDEIALTQTCRTPAELTYGNNLVARLQDDPFIGDFVQAGRLKHITSLTRAPHALEGRITTLIENGGLVAALGGAPLDPALDRAMICGSIAMLHDMRAICERADLVEGSNARPGTFVVERAFTD